MKYELNEAKEWLLECAGVSDDFDGGNRLAHVTKWLKTATEAEIISRVNEEFDGGWKGFLLTV